MNGLTVKEKKVLNNLSEVLDQGVSLGNRIQEIIGAISAISSVGTPKNAVSAKETLSITGVVIDGETVIIFNPVNSEPDIYEFLADVAQTKTNPTNIAVNISEDATAASCVLTIDTQPTSGDTMTIGEKVYTFVPVGTDTADGEISIGVDLAGAQAAIIAAINGTDAFNDPNPLVSAAAFAANATRISALVGGAAGNLVATTETFTAATNVFADVTLLLGADCSAADAIIKLVAAILVNDAQGVTGAPGEAGTIILGADVAGAGAAGNDIIIDINMANGSMPPEVSTLSGGVDATVTDGIAIMVDDDYLYTCPIANPITGMNWRRIALGDSF